MSDSDPELKIEFSQEDGFAALPLRDEGEVRWIYQSGIGVKPGTYTLVLTIVEEGTGRIGSWKEIVEVPDLSQEGLLLSDLVLAREIENRSEPSHTPYKEPFLHGELKVVPKIDPVYHNGEELGFYFQIYGAQVDPQDERPKLDLEYRFEMLDEKGTRLVTEPVRLGSQDGLSQAYSFPLQEWPTGSYRLTVQVTDRLSGATAERSAGFSIGL